MDENEEGEEESGEEEEEEEEEGEEEEVVEEEEKQDLESELSRVSFQESYEGAVSLGVLPTETVPKVRKRREHGVITEEHLKEISQELGLIKLCWPEVPSVDFEGRVHYPLSYTQNTKKEKLLLWYAENFRQQINDNYPDRRPLLIACDNECKIQKMVCTTIRPTTLKFPEFQTWQGCASFVAEHLTYEQLDSPTVLPDRINSPQTVLKRQYGHSFEYATLLASFLIGSGYNAYVVSGYATREVCEKNQTRVDCPYLTEIPEYKSGKEKEKEKEIEKEKQKEKEKEKQKEKEKHREKEYDNENENEKEKEKEGPKYFLKKPIELESQFLLEMEAREIQKQKEAEKAQELAELEAIQEFEKPRYDHLWGWRLHSWVLILPSKDVTRPIFIETTTGIAKSIDDPEYHGIESLWNHQNYWVLVQFQTKTESCKDISFDLNNPNHWERLLIGEPITFRRVPSRVMDLDTDDYKKACIEAEKHLDMPTSWVDILQLPHSVYEARYPRARKIIHYRKAMAELFSPYSQSDGLMERVTCFDDYFQTDPIEIREKYANREDHMYFCQKLVRESAILEKFERGREDALREHFYYANNSGIEVRFTLLFYHDARLDGACKLVMDPLYMDIYFEERKDFLYYLHVDFEKRVNYDQPFRAIRKITVNYHRNPDKDAAKDVAMVEFFLMEKKFEIKFHYEPEHLTQNQRTFLKPSFMEKGAQLIFDPSMTYGYLTGPNVPPPKPLYLYRLELEYFKEEEILEKKIRERENELFSLLRLRAQELASPRLLVSEFDVERNVDAKKAFKDKEQQKKDMEERDMDMTCDYLAPYYTKYGYKPKSVLPKKDATKVLEECLQDWKSLLVARANHLQREFEQACQDFQDKNDWYEVNQSTITKEQEEEYFEYCKTNSYLLHLLEVRLIRHKEMAPRRYMIINSYLKSDPRLAQAFQKTAARPKERQ